MARELVTDTRWFTQNGQRLFGRVMFDTTARHT
jgi:hypothetical protein